MKRGNEPSSGRWGLPGGVVELGETVEEAVSREVKEETGLDVIPKRLITVFDSIVREGDRIRFHYILCEFLCKIVGGKLQASSDVLDARLVSMESLDNYDIRAKTKRFIKQVKQRTCQDDTKKE